MPLPGYDETLDRFGLGKLKSRVDLHFTKSGDIAITRDGDFQMEDTQFNALFRFVEGWRRIQSTFNYLFSPMLRASLQLEELSKTRAQDMGPSLIMNPKDYHAVTDSILECQSVSSVLSGAILVVFDSLLQRLKKDLNASDGEWELSGTKINNHSIGVIFAAATANFRHYDEWACAKKPKSQQLPSMEVLCEVLSLPVLTAHGFPTIRTNVCGDVLMRISHGSVDILHQITFGYAKALSKYP
jgi:hypothetical protein